MRRFVYQRARRLGEAVQMAATVNGTDARSRNKAEYLAGGTTLIDFMKLDVMRPGTLIDINPLAEAGYARIDLNEHGLRLGALVRMADVADHAGIKTEYPVVAQSLAQAASQQLRNMASLGGNVLQRTRCTYFRDVSFRECNKRSPGSGCAALTGFNRMHAVLGGSDDCIATYPGDFAQALIALDAAVEIVSRNGTRTIAFRRIGDCALAVSRSRGCAAGQAGQRRKRGSGRQCRICNRQGLWPQRFQDRAWQTHLEPCRAASGSPGNLMLEIA
jgi:xanthine dehydrogenase YagS FAD-binding subunit